MSEKKLWITNDRDYLVDLINKIKDKMRELVSHMGIRKGSSLMIYKQRFLKMKSMIKLWKLASVIIYHVVKIALLSILIARSLVYGLLSWMLPAVRQDKIIDASSKAVSEGLSMINIELVSDDDGYDLEDESAYPRSALSYNYDYK